MAEANIVERVLSAATQGAVGAVVGAILSAFTEPVVNRVLVKRVPLSQALKETDMAGVAKFFNTTLPTNFIKFPFFEAVNVIMANFDDLSPTTRGALTGAMFCTATLPIGNYRFRKSMGLPIEASALYQAYLPTVLRDVVYGIVRNKVSVWLYERDPVFAKSAAGRFVNMFLTVIMSCVISAPGNEYRGYCLQPKDRRQDFSTFFQPAKFVRSTTIGALIMGTALGVGALVTPKVDELYKKIRAQSAEAQILLLCFVIGQWLESRRHDKVIAELRDEPATR